MESHLTEEALWANAVGGRLRLLQASLADGEPKQREVFLAEELDRALQPVPPSRREACLRALEDLFPAWGGAVTAAPGEAVASMPTPEELIKQLEEAASGMNEAEREALLDKLRQAGLAPQHSQPGAAEAIPEFSKYFGFSDGTAPDLARQQKMILGLSAVFLALDQLVWTLWRQLNGKSMYRKEAEFGRLAGPYLAGDREVSSEQIRQSLERTRRLIAALLGAMGRSGATFAQKHSADLSPESIENAARIEKKAFEGLEAASWRKYRELYREYATEQTLESQIQRQFVLSAEELLRGIGR
jgi:hypothetical protein